MKRLFLFLISDVETEEEQGEIGLAGWISMRKMAGNSHRGLIRGRNLQSVSDYVWISVEFD